MERTERLPSVIALGGFVTSCTSSFTSERSNIASLPPNGTCTLHCLPWSPRYTLPPSGESASRPGDDTGRMSFTAPSGNGTNAKSSARTVNGTKIFSPFSLLNVP